MHARGWPANERCGGADCSAEVACARHTPEMAPPMRRCNGCRAGADESITGHQTRRCPLLQGLQLGVCEAHCQLFADREVDEEFVAGYTRRRFARWQDQMRCIARIAAQGARDRRIGVDIENGDPLPVSRRNVGCCHGELTNRSRYDGTRGSPLRAAPGVTVIATLAAEGFSRGAAIDWSFQRSIAWTTASACRARTALPSLRGAADAIRLPAAPGR